VLLVGCGPSEREVDLQNQLEKTEKRLEKAEERLANTEQRLATAEQSAATAEQRAATAEQKAAIGTTSAMVIGFITRLKGSYPSSYFMWTERSRRGLPQIS
jgi:chromosome segregation ATPase